MLTTSTPPLLLLLTLSLLPALTTALANPQTFTNNAPFSGAIYLVDPAGQTITSTSTNYCPATAPVSCGDVGAPTWCCPTSYTCTSAPSSALVGCCPAGSSCTGSINVASVTTVTVQVAGPITAQTTVYVPEPIPPTTTTLQQFVYAQGGYCSTLTAKGPGLPTARAGGCGTILVVSAGERGAVGSGVGLGMKLGVLVWGVAAVVLGGMGVGWR